MPIGPIDHGLEACGRLDGEVVGKDPQRLPGDIQAVMRWGRQKTVTSVTFVTPSTIAGDARTVGRSRPVTFRRPRVTRSQGR